jgi:signal transduction histidine kinase
MVTEDERPSAALSASFLCPQCQRQVEVRDVVCPACGVDLAWAAALAERQVLASLPAAVDIPYRGDVLLPRFGEYLLQHGYITEAHLSAALARQREAAQRGARHTIGQTLFEMGVVTREQLDLASIEQVQQLQGALQTANQQLEHRVADRTRALQQALRQLAALSELKSNLVGNLAHSLRSPVVPIRGYSSMMVEGRLGPLTSQQQDAMETILRCTDQLETAINELSQLTANLKGQVHLNPALVNVLEQAERLRGLFASQAEAAQVRLRFDLAPDLPAVAADAEKVWWALFQLLEHPLKLMAAGDELALTISAANGKVRYAVRDMAPTLPLAQRDDIMRLPPEYTSRLAGIRSWSLAQIKRIVEAHGTRFAIECHPDRGTTVWFELPAVAAP